MNEHRQSPPRADEPPNGSGDGWGDPGAPRRDPHAGPDPGAGPDPAAERFGPHRLIFGTGLPVWDPALPVTGLTYAGLAPDALAAVAGGTLTALLDGCLT